MVTQIKQIRKKVRGDDPKRHQQNRDQGGARGGGKLPPGLGGSGGSEVLKERKKVWSIRKKRIGKKYNSEDQKNGAGSTRRPDGSADLTRSAHAGRVRHLFYWQRIDRKSDNLRRRRKRAFQKSVGGRGWGGGAFGVCKSQQESDAGSVAPRAPSTGYHLFRRPPTSI